jgi:cellulose synthase (UDP-forming)
MSGATTSRVEKQRVFRLRDVPLYALLTLLNLAAVILVFGYWIGAASWSWQTPAYLLLTGSVLLPLAMFESRWVVLPLMSRPKHMTASPGRRVAVATTFVPGLEDLAMLRRTVSALVAMDYPHATWVLDEGDDPEVRRLCHSLGARHFSRKHIDRYQQTSGPFAARTKHGNYNAWLDAIAYGQYDIVSGFDPDHVPDRRFLTRVLGYFNDPDVGYVQAPQVYYNQRASFVARGAAEESYAYYSSVQMSAYALGVPVVTGCHNTHRVRALRDVGGFAAHEADDLLITILYRVARWGGVYVPERLAAGLAPADLDSYLTQQRRWARSVLDVKLRILPRLAKGLSLRERVFVFLHGLYYLHGLGSALGAALLAFMLLTGRSPAVFSVATGGRVGALWLVLWLGHLYRQRFFLDPSRERGVHWRAAILRVAKWPHVLMAIGDVVGGPNRGYALTRKVRATRRHYSGAWPQLIVGGLIGTAWAVGQARGVPLSRAIIVGAVCVLASSALVVFSDLRGFPPPYNDDLARQELGSDAHSLEASAGPLLAAEGLTRPAAGHPQADGAT